MIIFANATQYSFFESEILSCENDKDKEFENSNNKMKLLIGLIATGCRNFADLISLLSSHISSLTSNMFSNIF